MNGLFVHRSHRVEDLAAVLAAVLRAGAPTDPMTSASVVVGSRGMARWLKHRIATENGICAQVDFPFPAEALGGRVDQALGATASPWNELAMTLAILELLPEAFQAPELQPVRDYLAPEGGFQPGARATYGFAAAAAETLDRVAVHRPDWGLAWGEGRQPDALRDAPHAGWQALLWRGLEERLGPSPPRRLHELAELEAPATPFEPIPLCIFGLPALPVSHLQAIDLLARWMPVHLFVPVPSPRHRDERKGGEGHPLLASYGRLSRDLQGLLEELPRGYREMELPSEPTQPGDVLGWLQDDVVHNCGPKALEAVQASRVAPKGDDSLQLHACYGPTRQVEALHDALLALFQRHPHLEPRDVLVMTPDPETYLPLVDGVFSAAAAPGLPQIPVSLSGDRSRTDAGGALLLELLARVEGRRTNRELLELLAHEPVRRRFDLAGADLETIRGWVREAGVRWGLDEDDRRAEGQVGDERNTWRFGLERLALGAVSPEGSDTWCDRLPLEGLEGDGLIVLGRFLEAGRRLMDIIRRLGAPRTVPQWASDLFEALTELWPAGELDQLQAVRAALARWSAAAEHAGSELTLSVGAVRQALEASLGASAADDRPITGAVTVSGLSPMRSVPYPVVALLGMDDGGFPRQARTPSFDLIRARPRPGDRDPREEDRHLFLEALLSARRHLLIFSTEGDPRTQEPLPPALPVTELLEAVGRSCEGAERAKVRHPLQPFSTSAFTREPRSFDTRMLEVGRALFSPRQGSLSPFRDGPLQSLPFEHLTLDELARGLAHPVRYLLRHRAKVDLFRADDALDPRDPVELDPLERAGLRSAVFERLWGAPSPRWKDEQARLEAEGCLSSASAGLLFARLRAEVEAAMEAAGPRPSGEVLRVGVRVRDVRLEGAVEVAEGRLHLPVTTDPLRPGLLMQGWVQALAVAADRGTPIEARLTGVKPASRSGAPPRPVQVTLRASPELASTHLAELLALLEEGSRAPLPLPPRATLAFAWALRDEKAPWCELPAESAAKALAAARGVWSSLYGPESAHPELALVFPDGPPFEAEDGGPDPDFVEVAERLWRPVWDALERT